MRRKLSRLERHRRKQSNRTAVVYVLLSIVFILGMFKWGLPGLIRVVSLVGGNTDIVDREKTGVRPQTPALEPVPEATFSASIKVAGAAQADTTIKLRVNGLNNDEVESDGEGEFSFKVKLLPGENKIEVQAVDDQDQESGIARAIVKLDTTDPELTIISPEEEHKFFGLDQRSLSIVGEVSESEDKVTVSGNFVRVGSDGRFSHQTLMEEGANEYVIRVVDEAGNVTERLFRVFYTP